MGKDKRTERAPRNKLRTHVTTQDIKRKQLKPITEKIRRERINNSLHELKVLVLSGMNKDVLHYSKMEKADILDMAVKYIKCIQTAKQESKDGCLGPTQGDHQVSEVTSSDKAHIDTYHASRRQSNTTDIDSENSCSGMISLVQPEVPKYCQAYATMATQKNHASSVLAGYIPSSEPRIDFHQPNTPNPRGNTSPTHENIRSRLSSPSLGISNENFKMRSPLAEKKNNEISTPTTDFTKKLPMPTSSEKRQITSPMKSQSRVRLPGMECFVKDLAEHFKENQIYNDYFLMNQRRELETDQFENAQYSLPLWRPW